MLQLIFTVQYGNYSIAKSAIRRSSPSLFFEVELLDHCGVAARVVLLEIGEMVLAICDHTEQSAARVVVLLVLLEVVGEFGDPLAQKGYLDLRRAGVFVMDRCFLDDLGLLTCG